MTFPAWITTVIAIYAAVLATANVIIQLRAKRWSIEVKYTSTNHPNGARTIEIYALNYGERNITIVSVFLETVVYRASYVARVLQWARRLRNPNLPSVRNMVATYEARNALNQRLLPAELKPGESIGMSIPLATIALAPIGSAKVGVRDGLDRKRYARKKLKLPAEFAALPHAEVPKIVPQRQGGNLAAEIQDLESYLASVPDDLKSRGVFAAYEERLQALRAERSLAETASYEEAISRK